MRCVLHACVPYVFNGTLARRKKTVLGKLAIKNPRSSRHSSLSEYNQVGTQFLETGFSGEQRLLVRPIEKCSSRVG